MIRKYDQDVPFGIYPDVECGRDRNEQSLTSGRDGTKLWQGRTDLYQPRSIQYYSRVRFVCPDFSPARSAIDEIIEIAIKFPGITPIPIDPLSNGSWEVGSLIRALRVLV